MAVIAGVGAALLLAAGIMAAGPPDPVAGPTPTIPALSSAQAGAAVNFVKGDAALRQLIGNAGFTVSGVGVWHTHSLQTIGAVVQIAFPAPLTITGSWPVISYDNSETSSPPYAERFIDATASNVSSLLIAVDLKRSKVVSVQPGPGATFNSSAQPVRTSPTGE